MSRIDKGVPEMRRLIALVPAALALATAGPALAATKAVQIKAGGFVPVRVEITSGDAIRWTNVDKVNHQVVSDHGLFASSILRPGQSYTRTFNQGGTYRYHDGMKPAEKGVVVVKGPPPSVSIGATVPIVTYGSGVTLSGNVSTQQPNESVQVYAQVFGQASYALVATVLTGTGGSWSYATKPEALTFYKARWGSRESAVATIGVAPSISLRRIGGWFVVKAVGARKFARRAVQVQRLNSFNQWVTVKKVMLNSSSAQRFKVKLPKGINRLRIAMSINQAGAGYLGAYSKTIQYTRKK
jgi:plastocyanin